jgi:hypothetical protein
MLCVSAGTVISEVHVAGFPAVRAIIKPIHTKPHAYLALADGAVFFTGAVLFRLFTLAADNLGAHENLFGKLYLRMGRRGKLAASLLREETARLVSFNRPF